MVDSLFYYDCITVNVSFLNLCIASLFMNSFLQVSLRQEKRNFHPSHAHVYCCCLLQWTAGNVMLLFNLVCNILIVVWIFFFLTCIIKAKCLNILSILLLSSGRQQPGWTSCGVCRPSRKWRTWGSCGNTTSVYCTTSFLCTWHDIFWTGATTMRCRDPWPHLWLWMFCLKPFVLLHQL